MDMKTYQITLADGTVLENLRLNGNNFISAAPLEKSVFEENLSPVIISDGDVEEHHENMALVQLTMFRQEYWFILRDLTEDELWKMKMEANQTYLAMMSDIDL